MYVCMYICARKAGTYEMKARNLCTVIKKLPKQKTKNSNKHFKLQIHLNLEKLKGVKKYFICRIILCLCY